MADDATNDESDAVSERSERTMDAAAVRPPGGGKGTNAKLDAAERPSTAAAAGAGEGGGLEHLQRAARELIAAARSVLDAAEELVDDPAAVKAVMSGVRTVVTAVARAAGSDTSGPAAEPGAHDSGIERIDIG